MCGRWYDICVCIYDMMSMNAIALRGEMVEINIMA